MMSYRLRFTIGLIGSVTLETAKHWMVNCFPDFVNGFVTGTISGLEYAVMKSMSVIERTDVDLLHFEFVNIEDNYLESSNELEVFYTFNVHGYYNVLADDQSITDMFCDAFTVFLRVKEGGSNHPRYLEN